MQFLFDFDKAQGPIRAMHAIGQPPTTNGSMFHYLTEASIPYSRLHDVGGAYGGNRYPQARDFNNIK